MSAPEEQVAQWRAYVDKRRTISSADADELESHLRDRIDALEATGLDGEEAFLVSVRRMGRLDDVSHEFAVEHSDRLWKQLVIGQTATPAAGSRHGFGLAVLFALIAAAVVKVPSAFGTPALYSDIGMRLIPILFLAPLAAYFLVRRRASAGTAIAVAAPFVVVGGLLLGFPFDFAGMTLWLALAHAVVLLWLVIGIAYTDGEVGSGRRRMDFIRFTGEWVVYAGLILVGGVLLAAIAAGSFALVGVDMFGFIFEWMAPCGTAAAFIVAAWLVEEKQSVIENILPVLTRLFTPLFTVVLLALVIAFVAQNDLIDGSRELLIILDIVLIAAAGLLLYTMSARDPDAPAGWFEGVQLTMVLSALVVDAFVLAAMVGRIGEYGASANKLASLGINVIMLVVLAGAAWLLIRFLRGRTRFAVLERWQTSYLPVYLAWAIVVVAVFPPVFAFA